MVTTVRISRGSAKVPGEKAEDRPHEHRCHDADEAGEHEVHAVGDVQLDGEDCCDDPHLGLGKVDNPVAPVDQDDPHGEQGVDRPVDDPEQDDPERQTLGQHVVEDHPCADGCPRPRDLGSRLPDAAAETSG